MSDNVLNVEEAAEHLHVSTAYVYRHKHALGGFQAVTGGRLLFFESRLNNLGDTTSAVSDEKWKMEGRKDDRRAAKAKNIPNKKGSSLLGSSAKCQYMGRREELNDPYSLLA